MPLTLILSPVLIIWVICLSLSDGKQFRIAAGGGHSHSKVETGNKGRHRKAIEKHTNNPQSTTPWVRFTGQVFEDIPAVLG
jgi:hypothetical protein